MRAHGTGGLVKLKYKDKKSGKTVESRYWYIFYRVNRRLVRESSETESKMEAEKLLQRRMGEAGLGMTPEQDVKSVRYEHVRDSWFAEHKTQGRAMYTRADGTETVCGLEHLNEFFKGMPVTRITSDTLRQYIGHRRKKGYSDPTIRRNLVILRSMLNMARKEGKLRLVDIPHFPMPKDSKPRTGFVNPDVFHKLRETLPANLRPLITFIYFTGCRAGAAQKITWQMINKECTEVNLPGDITKTGEPLLLPLTGVLDEVAKSLKKMFRTEGPVFTATNLRMAWMKACHKLGLGVLKKDRTYTGLTIHDLRRSAARNLIRAGVSRGVAMTITGHKTEAVFERYNITDTADVRDALVRVGEYARRAK